jgi:hypothetical protein
MNVRIGQPAEHLPHWKHRRTELPDKASTFFTKPRFMVSRESNIFAFLIPPGDLAFTVRSPCYVLISACWKNHEPFCKTHAKDVSAAEGMVARLAVGMWLHFRH